MDEVRVKSEVINRTVLFVRETLKSAEGGHDWWHIQRVRAMAGKIAAVENADTFVVELGALLHDIADSKFHDGDEEIGPEKARVFLGSLGVDPAVIDQVDQIIRNISFKGPRHIQGEKSVELQVVQDADRLDALGAIGIARTFNYGGHTHRELYNPDIKPHVEMSTEEYRKSTAPTINHFYEKLLLLKDRMNTETGRQWALKRHETMVSFLDSFFREWDGVDCREIFDGAAEAGK